MNSQKPTSASLRGEDVETEVFALHPLVVLMVCTAYAYHAPNLPVRGLASGVYGKGIPIGDDMWHAVSAARRLDGVMQLGVELICRSNAFGDPDDRHTDRWWIPSEQIEALYVSLPCVKVQ